MDLSNVTQYASPGSVFVVGRMLTTALPKLERLVNQAAASLVAVAYGHEHGEDEKVLRAKMDHANVIVQIAAAELQPELGSHVSLSMTLAVVRELVEREAEQKVLREASRPSTFPTYDELRG